MIRKPACLIQFLALFGLSLNRNNSGMQLSHGRNSFLAVQRRKPMKPLTRSLSKSVVAAAALLVAVHGAWAQSADAIIDKLVEKGILTSDEATELRQESDQGFDQAFRSKTGMSDVITGLDFSGDFRGRFEGFFKDGNPTYAKRDGSTSTWVDRTRWRYRLRVGVTLDLIDQFEFGFQLGSGDLNGLSSLGGIDPISQNQSLDNNASKKGIFVNLAYATWSPLRGPEWQASTTFGKMNNPFVTSDLMFDSDYTPEGFAQTFGYRLNEAHSLDFAGGAFVLDEISGSSNDPYLFGGQGRWNAQWKEQLKSSVDFGIFSIINRDRLGNFDVPNVNIGNDRIPGVSNTNNATPLHAFNALSADASLTYVVENGIPLYSAKFPISLVGNFVYNLSAPEDNTGYAIGIDLGKAGKKGLWAISYRWKYLEANGWYEELLDSDTGAFYAGLYPNSGQDGGYRTGTNVKGHVVKLQYSPFNVLTFAVTGFFTEAVNAVPDGDNSSIFRLQADAQIKF